MICCLCCCRGLLPRLPELCALLSLTETEEERRWKNKKHTARFLPRRTYAAGRTNGHWYFLPEHELSTSTLTRAVQRRASYTQASTQRSPPLPGRCVHDLHGWPCMPTTRSTRTTRRSMQFANALASLPWPPRACRLHTCAHTHGHGPGAPWLAPDASCGGLCPTCAWIHPLESGPFIPDLMAQTDFFYFFTGDPSSIVVAP